MSKGDPKWSVRLLLSEEESIGMTQPEVWPLHNGVIRMVIGGFEGDEVEESPFVTLELTAADADAAGRLAQQLVGSSFGEASLATRVFPIVWVAPLRDEPESSHRFLEQAKGLFNSEQFDLAIVAAQIHFELQVRLLLERAAVRADSRWAKRLVQNRRVAALANDVSKATVELLLGIDVTKSRHWPEFKAHLDRRNAVVHEGQSMGSKEAAASVKVVQALWAVLAEAERSSTLF